MSELDQIQKLREMTGAGIMDCKQALQESEFNIDTAIDYLREKGKAEAAKKSAREAKEGIVYSYIHPGNKLGVLVEVNCETDFVARNDEFGDLVKEIAMQIAASDPKWITREDVDEDEIEREKQIIKKQLTEQGKPEHIMDKIIEGKLNKFYSQNCLVEQPYIRDDKKSVDDLIKDAVAKIGENIVISRFARFKVGE
ncbi:MAG: translation elongation factor Ts [Elusimicrobiota bacterium]